MIKRKTHKITPNKKFHFLSLSVKIKVSYLLILGGILLLLVFVNNLIAVQKMKRIKKTLLPQAVKKIINNDKTKFTIKSIKRTNGLYEFKLKVGNRDYTSYLSRDAKLLFISGTKVDNLLGKKAAKQTANNQKKLTCKDLSKSAKPQLTAFVMSHCPFGLQMQRVFNKTITEQPLLKNNLSIRYIGDIKNNKISSMHGDEEGKEDLRQICIREEQNNKFFPYLACYMQKGETKKCEKKVKINLTKLNSCTKNPKRGLKYAQKDFALAKKLNIGGSPTLLLNNKQIVSEFDFGGRTPESLKQIICCSMTKQASFCKKKLSQDTVATSFSTQESTPKKGGSAPAAQCN